MKNVKLYYIHVNLYVTLWEFGLKVPLLHDYMVCKRPL